MSDPSSRPDPTQSDTRSTWLVVAALLAVGAIVPLFVWTYDSETPVVGGFPFFYWFQFLLIPIVSGLTYIAFRLSETATARDRKARRDTGSKP